MKEYDLVGVGTVAVVVMLIVIIAGAAAVYYFAMLPAAKVSSTTTSSSTLATTGTNVPTTSSTTAQTTTPSTTSTQATTSTNLTVKPNGVNDTADIQNALNACASPNPPCTVQLTAGTYIISSQIAVTGFQGRFVGMGQGQTTIKALGNMQGTTVTPYWAQFPPRNHWPSLFTFVNGSFTMAGMTITDTSPTPTTGWHDITGGCSEEPCTALTEAIKVSGLKANAAFDHITIVGAAGDYGGYNIAEGIHIEGLQLPVGWTNPEADTHLLTGTFSINNSMFTDTAGPVVNFLLNSNVVICGNSASTPDINNVFNLDLVTDISNTHVLICGNQATVPFGPAIGAFQSVVKSGLLPSTVIVTDNNFQLNQGASAVILQDAGKTNFGTPPTLSAVVSGNVFRDSNAGSQWQHSVIQVTTIRSTNITSNTIAAGGAPGIYLNGGPGMVSGNNITGAYTGVWLDEASGVRVANNTITDSVEYGIALTSNNEAESSATTPPSNDSVTGNTVRNSGTYDLYWGGSGSNDQWCGNVYTSSSPKILPSC